MNSGYYPNVVNHMATVQNQSYGFQTPFYFGGSQVPDELQMPKGSYNGSGLIKKIKQSEGKVASKLYKLPNNLSSKITYVK